MSTTHPLLMASLNLAISLVLAFQTTGCGDDEGPPITIPDGAGICSPSNCNGCCQGNACMAGATGAACGAAGLPCVKCTSGELCAAGVCTTSSCNPSSCATGCCKGKTCMPGTAKDACGSGGNLCTSCAASQKCESQTCGCGPGSCNGCCEAGVCRSGIDISACGTGGAACSTCTSSQICLNGGCTDSGGCSAATCNGSQCLSGLSGTACASGGDPCRSCAGTQLCIAGACKLDPNSQWGVVIGTASISTAKSWDTAVYKAPDPYVELSIGSSKGSTTVINNTYSPKWDEYLFTTSASAITTHGMTITVYDDDVWPISDEVIGSCHATVDDSVLASGGGIVTGCGSSGHVKQVTFSFTKK